MLLEKTRGNDFLHVPVIDSGRRIVHLRAICSRCDDEGDVKLTGTKQTLPQDWAEKSFQKRGWVLGKDRTSDVCSSCVKKELEERREATRRMRDEQKNSALVAICIDEEQSENAHQQTDEEYGFIRDYIESHLNPRDEERDIRRYQRGWSDEKVLVELQNIYPNLRLQTVQQIRTREFGVARRIRNTPASANEKTQFEILLARLQDAENRASRAEQRAARAEQECALNRAFTQKLADRIADVSDDVDDMKDFYKVAMSGKHGNWPIFPSATNTTEDHVEAPTQPEQQSPVEALDACETAPPVAEVEGGEMLQEPVEGSDDTQDRALQIISGFVENGESDMPDMYDSYFDELRQLLPPSHTEEHLYRVVRLSKAEVNLMEKHGITLPPHRYSAWTKRLDVAERRAARTRRGKVSVVIEQTFNPQDIVVDLEAFYVTKGLAKSTTPTWGSVKRNHEVIVAHGDLHVTSEQVVSIKAAVN